MRSLATEAVLTGRLVDALKSEMPNARVYKHNDRITVAIPDISITHHGRTLWVEVKVSRGGKVRYHEYWRRQLLELTLLELQGFALFVIYEEEGIVVASPSKVRENCTYEAELNFDNHKDVAAFLRTVLR